MKNVNVALVVLAVVVLAGGLAGCRSGAKAQPNPCDPCDPCAPAPIVQAPTPCDPCDPCAPSAPSPSYQGTYPSPGAMPQGTVVSRRVIPNNEVPPSLAGSGSPDGMIGGGDFAPAPLPAPSSMVPVIADGASAGADLDVELHRLREQLNQVRLELAEAEAAPAAPVADTGATGGSLAAQFADDLRGKTGGDVQLRGNTVVVRVTDCFASGSNQLKKDSSLMSTLQATASALTGAPAATVEVVGHSDITPLNKTKAKWGTNKRLSEARAQSVATELSRHGVPACRMEVKGMGSAQLLDASNSKRAHAKNRRVEVVVRF